MHTSSLDASIGATHALVLAVAAGVEGLTGLALLIAPFIVTHLYRHAIVAGRRYSVCRSRAGAVGRGRPALSGNRGLAQRGQYRPVAPIAAWAADLQPSHRRAAAISRYSWRLARDSVLAGGGAARFPNSASRAHLGITNGGRAVLDDRGPDSVMIATGATPLRACPGVRTHGLASVAAMPAFSWRLAVADSRCKVKRLNVKER